MIPANARMPAATSTAPPIPAAEVPDVAAAGTPPVTAGSAGLDATGCDGTVAL